MLYILLNSDRNVYISQHFTEFCAKLYVFSALSTKLERFLEMTRKEVVRICRVLLCGGFSCDSWTYLC